MKSFLLAAALLGATLPVSALAYTPKDAASTPAPRVVPTSVVKPGLPPGFSRALIDVEFTLDQTGRPQDIKVRSVKDPVLKRHLVEAFRQWRFDTGTTGADTTAKRFVIPLDVRAES